MKRCGERGQLSLAFFLFSFFSFLDQNTTISLLFQPSKSPFMYYLKLTLTRSLTKVLILTEWGYPDFFMGWDALLSCPILALSSILISVETGLDFSISISMFVLFYEYRYRYWYWLDAKFISIFVSNGYKYKLDIRSMEMNMDIVEKLNFMTIESKIFLCR